MAIALGMAGGCREALRNLSPELGRRRLLAQIEWAGHGRVTSRWKLCADGTALPASGYRLPEMTDASSGRRGGRVESGEPKPAQGRANQSAPSSSGGDQGPAGSDHRPPAPGPQERLRQFLETADPRPSPSTMPSPKARSLLLQRVASALGANRSGVLASTPQGSYQGWGCWNLPAADARRFLALELAGDDPRLVPLRWDTPALVSWASLCRAPGTAGVEVPADGARDPDPTSLAIGIGRQEEPAHGLLLLDYLCDRPPALTGEEMMLVSAVTHHLRRFLARAGQAPPPQAGSQSTDGAHERRLLRGLLEAGKSIHETQSLDSILQRIAAILADAGGFEAVAIYILEQESQLLHPAAIVGVDEVEAARMRAVSVALRDYAPLMRPDMRVGRSYLFDHRRHELPPASVLDSALSIPALPAGWRPGQWHPLDSLTIPLELTRGQLLGLVSLDQPRNRRYPTRDTVRALELFADQCAAAISRVQLFAYMEELALTDSLTGLHNRHALEQTLAQDLARIARSGGAYSVLFCDLDHFKRINDTMGHAAGDLILQQVAAVLRQRLRRGDFAARCGGDEFVVLLPDTPGSQALVVAEDLRLRISSASTACLVTASIGVSSPAEGQLDPKTVLDQADRAMYLAKGSGRNRVRMASGREERPARVARSA